MSGGEPMPVQPILDGYIALMAKQQGAAENVDLVVALARRSIGITPEGIPKVLDDAGNIRVGSGPVYGDMTVSEWMAETAASKPSLFANGKTPVEGEPPKADERPAAAPEPVANPFHPGSLNRTQAAIIEARDPARAVKLKAEAASATLYVRAGGPHHS